MEQKHSRPLQQQVQYAWQAPLKLGAAWSSGLATPVKNPGLQLQDLARRQARQQESEL